MDNQEIKNLLKTAKDALKLKDFKETLKICKMVIDKEKENYLAWVFTGAAAQELSNTMQAQAAFQRAIQIQASQAPAWQGLAQLYEKQGATGELQSVYNELRKIFANDTNKHYDYSLKYANALFTLSKFKQAIEIYHYLLKLQNKEKDSLILTQKLSEMLSDPNIQDQSSSIYFDLLEYYKNQPEIFIENEKTTAIYENAIKAIIKESQDWNIIRTQCFNLLNNYNDTNEFALNTIIEINFEILIGNLSTTENVEETLEELLMTLSRRTDFHFSSIEYYREVLNALKITKKLDQTTLSQFKKILEQIDLYAKNESKLLNVYLSNFYYSFVCDHANTIKSAKLGLSLLPSLIVKEIEINLTAKFNFNQAFSDYIQHKYTDAIECFTRIQNLKANIENQAVSIIKKESIRYLLECYVCSVNNKSYSTAIDTCKNILESNVYNSKWPSDFCDLLVKYYYLKQKDLFDVAKSLNDLNPECHDSNFMLAKITYDSIISERSEKVDREELKSICFQASIKAIKLSPFRWEAVFNLGNYYNKAAKDYKKALKCYQKTYELCQNLELCGLELVDCLLHEKEDEIAFNVLKKANEEIENCKWAQLRLGIIYLQKGDCNEAIRLFYNVIRNDPDDYNMWECLADAYMNRGSLTASLKSFNKAFELNPDSVYAAYQIAHIKQTLTLYDQAIIDYYAVLNKITNHVPTLKGLGETYYELANQNIQNSNDDKYFEYIELSIKYLTRAIRIRKDICCLWKVLGDCCLTTKVFANNETTISVPKCIIDKNFASGESEMVKVTKIDLLKLAEESFIVCCKLKPECGNFWYDLGLSYQHLASCDTANETSMLIKSKDCFIRAVNLEPENPIFWNTLGIHYSSNDKKNLAQHCFIKSLQLNDSNAVTWTNLGVFYLLNENLKLAHECFKKSQALDPEYSVAWIGQAYIAETVDIDQCIDLYRHAVELNLHTEAQYGYSRQVAKISTDTELKTKTIYKDYIEYLNAVPLASDCLVKYCERVDNNPHAFFLAGVFFEKLSLPLTAIQYYQKAIDISTDDTDEITILSRRGYARLLCEQKQYESALMQYKIIDVKNSFEDLFALARVFYKLGKYQQCSKIFENALAICGEKEKSIVYTGMGMAQSKYNIQEAITSFFKGFQCKVICIQSLFALCSIGLLKNDMKLINAVFKELDTLKSSKYEFDIVKLKAIYYSLRKEFSKAIRCISKFVHEYPTETRAWIELCLCLKRSKNYDLALNIGNILFKTSNIQLNLVFYDCIQFLLLQQFKINQFKDSEEGSLMKMFQKILHMYPNNLSSWSSFSQFLAHYEKEGKEFKQVSVSIEEVLAET